MNSFMGQNILEIREQPCPSQRKRIQNRMAQRKFREKAKARKQSHPPDNQTGGIGNEKSHDGPSNLPSSTIDPEPHDNGYACLTSDNHLGPLSAFTCSMLGIPDQDVQYNQNAFEGAAFTLPKSIKDTPHNLQTSNVEEQLQAFSTELLTVPEPRRRPCPPTEVDFGILPDPELAFFGNVQDQQKGQRPVERHRHRSAIDSCECDRGLLETPKHAHRIVQYQRAKLLDQVEQLLDKVESLYDVGISLEVLMDNNHLRDLLQRAMAGFRSQRDSETHNRGDELSLIK